MALSNPQKNGVLLFEAVALTGGWEAFEKWKNWGLQNLLAAFSSLGLEKPNPEV